MKGDVSVQNISGGGAVNEVEIGTELADETQLAKNRQDMENALMATFGQPNNGKLEFNNASQQAIANRLREPLARAGVSMSEPQLQDLAHNIVTYRDTKMSGLITDFNQLASVPGMNAGIMNTLRQETYLAPFHVIQVQMVGPKVGADLRNKAVLATLYALAGMLVYIAFRFEWIYGLGAVIAVFHDTIITLGLFSIFKEEISMTVIAALLDPGRLLDERHDRHLRSHSRESEIQPPGAAGKGHEHRHQPDDEPYHHDLGSDVLDRHRPLPFRRSCPAWVFFCVALWNYCRDVLFDIYCEPDRSVLAQLCR